MEKFKLVPKVPAKPAPVDLHQYKQEVGDNLRDIREGLGLTQEAMAKALGVKTKTSWSDYERGDHFPKPLIVYRLWTVFRIEPNRIWLPGGAPRLASRAPSGASSDADTQA